MVFGSRFVFYALAAGLCISLFQNCAKPNSANLNSRMPAQLDDNDAQIIQDIERDLALNSSAFAFSKASDEREQLKGLIDGCKRSMGSDRTDCIWKLIQNYMSVLAKQGYTVIASKEDCYLAVEKESIVHFLPNKTVLLCKLPSDGSKTVALDPGSCVGLEKSPADLTYGFFEARKSRFFQSIRKALIYKNAGTVTLRGVYTGELETTEFTDSCGSVHRISEISELMIQISVL